MVSEEERARAERVVGLAKAATEVKTEPIPESVYLATKEQIRQRLLKGQM